MSAYSIKLYLCSLSSAGGRVDYFYGATFLIVCAIEFTILRNGAAPIYVVVYTAATVVVLSAILWVALKLPHGALTANGFAGPWVAFSTTVWALSGTLGALVHLRREVEWAESITRCYNYQLQQYYGSCALFVVDPGNSGVAIAYGMALGVALAIGGAGWILSTREMYVTVRELWIYAAGIVPMVAITALTYLRGKGQFFA